MTSKMVDQLERLVLEMLYIAGDADDSKVAQVLRAIAGILTATMDYLKPD